jgi:cystathionine beta-lyase/cystathionine gamma-synthase
LTGAVSVPIYQTSTYVQEALGSHKGFEYARTQNPTRSALEKNLATLESGRIAHCFASGMSADHYLLLSLEQGRSRRCLGKHLWGDYRLFEKVLRGFGWTLATSMPRTSRASKKRFDLKRVSFFLRSRPTRDDHCRPQRGRGTDSRAWDPLAVDNTFMSPYFIRPIEFGADFRRASRRPSI